MAAVVQERRRDATPIGGMRSSQARGGERAGVRVRGEPLCGRSATRWAACFSVRMAPGFVSDLSSFRDENASCAQDPGACAVSAVGWPRFAAASWQIVHRFETGTGLARVVGMARLFVPPDDPDHPSADGRFFIVSRREPFLRRGARQGGRRCTFVQHTARAAGHVSVVR